MITIERVGDREYRLVMSTGAVRCYVTGTREDAEREAARIARGIAADAAWFARCDYPGCGGPADGSECRHPRAEDA